MKKALLEKNKDVLTLMGLVLLQLQTAEKLIRFCMTFVFQKNSSPLTIDILKNQEQSERKKTIGFFLKELRKHVSIHESFDKLLVDFLNNRNDFIHDLSRVQNFDLYSSDNAQEAKQFLYTLFGQTDKVVKVFSGLIMSWQEQCMPNSIQFTQKKLSENTELFSEIETYKQLVDHLFMPKRDNV